MTDDPRLETICLHGGYDVFLVEYDELNAMVREFLEGRPS
jgi:hypothetical protein